VSERQRGIESVIRARARSRVEEGGQAERRSLAHVDPRATTAGLAVARRRSLFFLPACDSDSSRFTERLLLPPPSLSYYRASSLLLCCPLLAGRPRALTANGINPEHTSSRFDDHFTRVVYMHVYIHIYTCGTCIYIYI